MEPNSQDESDDLDIEEENKGTNNVRWTTDMDRAMAETLLKQLTLGHKGDNGWKAIAYAQVRKSLWKTLDITVTNNHIRNRLKTLKFHCLTVDKCLKHGGFRWDEAAMMLMAPDSVWNEYLKKNPKAAACRMKCIPNFKDICRIHGLEYVIETLERNLAGVNDDGSHNDNGKEDVTPDKDLDDLVTRIVEQTEPTFISPAPLQQRSPPKRKRDSNSQSRPMNTTGSFGSHNEKHTQPSSKSQGVPEKRARDDHSEVGMVDIMSSLANGIQRIASAMEDKKPVNLSSVVQELSKIPDFSDELILQASEFLASEEKWARLFLALSGEQRKAWLLKRLEH